MIDIRSSKLRLPELYWQSAPTAIRSEKGTLYLHAAVFSTWFYPTVEIDRLASTSPSIAKHHPDHVRHGPAHFPSLCGFPVEHCPGSHPSTFDAYVGVVSVFPLPNVTIYNYGLGIWPENLYLRPNGQVLSTLINRPEVWQINPFKQQDGTLLHTFDGKASTLGIVETFPDIFHVIVGNFTTYPEFTGINGTYGVWELDFTAENVAPDALCTVSHIVDIPQAEALDGMEVLNHESGLVLVADTKAGVVYTVDVKNKTVEATITSQLFYSSPELYVGVDGIKLRFNATHSYLYFTNAAKNSFGRVQIDLHNGFPLSAVEDLPVLANGTAEKWVADDFVFDDFGNAYFTNAGNDQGIYMIPAPVFDATDPVFITPITGPTACRFGRTEADKSSFYITSTGGDLAYPPQNFTITSKLGRIDVDPQS